MKSCFKIAVFLLMLCGQLFSQGFGVEIYTTNSYVGSEGCIHCFFWDIYSSFGCNSVYAVLN